MSDQPVVRDLVVVGLDHTPAGSAALRWAVDNAGRRGARVLAVNVFDADAASPHGLERDLEGEHQQSRIRSHWQVIEALGQTHGRVPVAVSSVEGVVAKRLFEASQRAVLLVLGKPSDATHSTLPARLAAVSVCPVVVVDEFGYADFGPAIVPFPAQATAESHDKQGVGPR